MADKQTKPTTIDSGTSVPEKAMGFSEKQEKFETFVLALRRQQIGEDAACELGQHLFKDVSSASEADAITKQFADKNNRAFLGQTAKSGAKKHTHSYTLMVLNWGENLVGVTTSTEGVADHVHTVKLALDPKIMSLEAVTNMQGIEKKVGDSYAIEDIHKHSFKANIDKIITEVPPITVGYFFNESGEWIKGDVKKFSAPSSTGRKMDLTPVILAADCVDEKDHYSFDNRREAEILLDRVAQLEDKPSWFKGTLMSLQEKVFDAVDTYYPDLDLQLSHNTSIAEMAINLAAKKAKLNPNAKVRNRGSVVFPAASKDVTDKKDHFPINSVSQARNALSRVAQFKKSPKWYKGSLSTLQKSVRAAVKKKYPTIKVTGLSEFIALRFKEEGDVHFIHLLTSSVSVAKEDAAIYFEECPRSQIDVVKFESKENGENTFTDLGTLCLYDLSRGSFKSCSDPISLADTKGKGTVKIQMLREGSFQHEVYGDFDITLTKLQEISRNFSDGVLDREIAIDMNHITGLPAAAWVKELSITKELIKGKNRHVLNGHVELTPRGREAISSGDFKYFSSEYTDDFRDKETGKSFGTVLKGGGMTNRPWMPGLAKIELSEIRNNVGFMSKAL